MYNIDWMLFINKSKCVYCAVRTEFVGTILFHFRQQANYWSIPNFLQLCTSHTLEWTAPNIQFNVPLLPATRVIPILIIQFSEQISSHRTFQPTECYAAVHLQYTFRYSF